MTFTSFFALSLGKGFGVKDRVLLRDILNYRDLGRMGSLILSIFAITFIIEAIGALLLGEGGGVLKTFSLKEKLLGAYFQSITARTAGFNTLNIGNLSIFSAFLLIVFMFIGASPGSTGGGVKTITFATLFLTLTEQAPFINILFEDLSAFGTVGLSRGLTPHLTVAGRLHKVWQKEERR